MDLLRVAPPGAVQDSIVLVVELLSRHLSRGPPISHALSSPPLNASVVPGIQQHALGNLGQRRHSPGSSAVERREQLATFNWRAPVTFRNFRPY